MTKYYRNVIQVEILSDEPCWTDDNLTDLSEVQYQILYGHSSGQVTVVTRNEQVSEERMARLLKDQGRDPSFLIDEDEEDVARKEPRAMPVTLWTGTDMIPIPVLTAKGKDVTSEVASRPESWYMALAHKLGHDGYVTLAEVRAEVAAEEGEWHPMPPPGWRA